MPEMPRQPDILVTGASGFLGSHIMRLLAEQGRGALGVVHAHAMPAPGRSVQMDIADTRALMALVRAEKPSAIIHAGALTAPDYCESHPNEADAVNVSATGALAMAAFAADAHLTFISTDLVFDGEAGMYMEADPPSPTHHYARTKAQAEHYTRTASPDFAVVRPSFIYGEPLADHQSSFSHMLMGNLRSATPTRVFMDQYRSPIAVETLARAVLEVSDRRLPGIWHIAGPERVSRSHFARLLAEAAGLDASVLEDVSMDDVRLPAKRPRDVSLDVSKAQSQLETPLPALPDSLRALYGAGL
jgi:dTDP-4-dehydrorhamnose reductase